MKKNLLIAAVLVVAAFASNVNADVLTTAEHDAYKASNSNFVDFTINDHEVYSSDNDFSLFKLYNDYFDLKENDAFYVGSSNELYQAYGVESNTTWIAGSEPTLYAAYKNAALGNSIIANTVDGISSVLGTFTGQFVMPNTTGIVNLDNAANSLSISGEFTWELETGDGNSFYSDLSQNTDGLIHMVAIDVTEQMRAKLNYAEGENPDFRAYMMGWEDLTAGNYYTDYDYQDFVGIFTNITTSGDNITSTTPEPATLLILGLGVAAAPIVRRFRNKK